MTARPSGVVLKYVLPAVRDVERAALQRDQALAHELGAAVDEAGLLGAVLLGPVGHARQVGLVGLAEVGGVGVGDRALLAHPRHRGRRVEPAGERDADALADGQRRQDLRLRHVIARRSYPGAGSAARQTASTTLSIASASLRPLDRVTSSHRPAVHPGERRDRHEQGGGGGDSSTTAMPRNRPRSTEPDARRWRIAPSTPIHGR